MREQRPKSRGLVSRDRMYVPDIAFIFFNYKLNEKRFEIYLSYNSIIFYKYSLFLININIYYINYNIISIKSYN